MAAAATLRATLKQWKEVVGSEKTHKKTWTEDKAEFPMEGEIEVKKKIKLFSAPECPRIRLGTFTQRPLVVK